MQFERKMLESLSQEVLIAQDADDAIRAKDAREPFALRLHKRVARKHRAKHFVRVIVGLSSMNLRASADDFLQREIAHEVIFRTPKTEPPLVERQRENNAHNLIYRRLQNRLVEIEFKTTCLHLI